jgi:hypothetical protein
MTNLQKSDAIQVSETCLMELWDGMAGAPDNIAEKYALVDSVTRKYCGIIYRRKGSDAWMLNLVHDAHFITQEAVLKHAAFLAGLL